MLLTFANPHLSIQNFPTAELPSFCLLTGLNGAGKSHLLKALVAGDIRADCASNQSPANQTEIRLFDWSNLVPQDAPAYTSDTLKNERKALFTQLQQHVAQPQILGVLQQVARTSNIGQQYYANPLSIASLTEQQVVLIDPKDGKAKSEQIQLAIGQATNNLLSRFDIAVQAQFRALAEDRKKPILLLTEKDFLSSSVLGWGSVSVFQQSFSRLFVAYRDMKLDNQFREFQASKGRQSDFLSEQEFLKQNGSAPWEFVNNSLAEADLDFRINAPDLDEKTAFTPILTKVSSGITMPFSSLSSGEKVLMSFAFCVYYSADRRQLSSVPKLMLLDEVDAPLHPSMSKSMLSTIQNSLVRRFGICVIATTHSPSTVALAPEESIFAMKPGVPGIHKTSRAQALNILTFGVPTLAVSYDGRRQVFVESPSDAKNYDAIYKLLKPRLMSERSLEFIATGSRSAKGIERNTGCDNVDRIVSELSKAGNISVFGLLDWDGKRKKSDRIAVLAEGRRNGLENLILDPLAIAILIIRDFPNERHAIKVADDVRYIEFIKTLDKAVIEPITQAVSAKIFGEASDRKFPATYIDGLILDIDERHLSMDDHELEGKVLSAFPFLNAVSKGRAGAFMERIITTVFADCPSAVPSEIPEVLLDLLNRQVE